MPSCGATLDYMLEVFPVTEVIRMVLTASGECGVVDWKFLGLSMPWWVLICLLLLGSFGAVANWTLPRSPQRPPHRAEPYIELGQQQLHHAHVDAAQCVDVFGAHVLVHLVNGGIHHAELDDLRAGRSNEAAVGGSAARRESGRQPVTSRTARLTTFGELSRPRKKRLPETNHSRVYFTR